MFKCRRCGLEKDPSLFYKSNRASCKECVKARVRQNRKEKLAYYREYDRVRGSRRTLNDLQNYRAKFPNKYRAHCRVNNAIRDGKLERGTHCEYCGTVSGLVAHHDDYLKPLDVRWMCQACHVNWHIENGEGKNAI